MRDKSIGVIELCAQDCVSIGKTFVIPLSVLDWCGVRQSNSYAEKILNSSLVQFCKLRL
jgi:hypothetical protein